MRTGLTLQQSEILGANIKKVFWLFTIFLPGHSSPDYFWSTQAKTYDGQAYTFKVMAKEGDTNYGFSPLTLEMGSPESGQIPPSKTTIKVSMPNSVIEGLYASDFEGASITVRLICGADLHVSPTPDAEVSDEGTYEPYTYEEAEIMSWRFKVLSSHCIDQIMTWECQDWFTLHLEGEYPNTPLVSDLFPADIMKSDNVVVPVAFGQPFFPVRCMFNNIDATYIDGDTFTVVGNQTALFAAGQWCRASCGVDGLKSCWVDSSSFGGGVTTVNLTVASDTLTTNLTSVQINAYLLGESGITYTIDRARTPAEQSGKIIYLPATYTFKQDTVTGSDSQSYGVVQLICNRAAGTGPNDSNGIWGLDGGEVYDMPIKVSRSDLAAVISPPDIAAYLLEAFGVTSSEIDPVSQVAAAAIYAARGFNLNIGLWYRQEREKIISKLFSVSGMVPVYRDKVGFKILTKVPQLEIEEWMIMPGTFSIRNVDYTKRSDSGYVQWQLPTEPCDQVNKSLVAVKSTTVNKSDTTIECEWIDDSIKAQKAGKLALQRTLLRDKIVNFTAKGYFLTLEPGDMITINPANLGAEGVPYDILITRMTIREGLLVDVEAVKFSDALDDWDDLSASGIVVGEASTINAYTPVYQGQPDANGAGVNIITASIIIGVNGRLQTSNNPESDGGFLATNSALTCFDPSGNERFKAEYSGATAGNVTFGNYAGGQGCKWNQGTGLFDVAGAIAATSGTIAGWTIDSDEIKKIASNAGISLNSAIPALVVTDANGYERVLLGKSGANYGLTVKDESNKTIININDTNKNIAGWTVDDGKMYNTNSYISSASYISFGNTPPTAYGNNAGVWMGWTAGMTAKAQLSLYTDANNYFQFDGSKMLIKAANFALDASGNITATSATLSGAVTITSGSGYGNLSDKPTALSTINATEGTKLSGIATGATVGATWGTNLTERPTELTDGRITTALNASGVLVSKVIPATLAAPSGAGLYLGSDYMGYYNSGWKSFMKNDGTFQFNGDASNYISWNGATLTVRGDLTADNITSGIVSARTFQTAGTRLTAATTAGDGTVYVADTSLFPASGTGYIYDSSVDTFTYTGKSSTTLTGCSGVLTHVVGLAVGGLFKRMIVSSLDNEMHFFGDCGDGTIEELISLGIKTIGADTMIGVFGSADSNHIGVYGRSKDYYGVAGLSVEDVGVYGYSYSGNGVYGLSATDGIGVVGNGKYGGYFGYSGSGAPIALQASEYATAPTHTALKGSITLTSTGIPYHNMDGSTTWYETVMASLKGTFTWDPANMASDGGALTTVAVTGAALGDYVIVCAPYYLNSVIVSAYVKEADVIEIILKNCNVSDVNLASGTWKYKVIKH